MHRVFFYLHPTYSIIYQYYNYYSLFVATNFRLQFILSSKMSTFAFLIRCAFFYYCFPPDKTEGRSGWEGALSFICLLLILLAVYNCGEQITSLDADRPPVTCPSYVILCKLPSIPNNNHHPHHHHPPSLPIISITTRHPPAHPPSLIIAPSPPLVTIYYHSSPSIIPHHHPSFQHHP